MNHELEPQQYYPLYQEEDVPLIDVRKSTLRKLVWGTILLLAAFIALGFTVHFPNEITVPYVLKSEQPERIYQFSHTVFLLDKMVAEQEIVQVGQPLVKITSPEIVEMLASINQKESELVYHLEQAALAVSSEKDILRTQMKSLKVDRERQKEEQRILKAALEADIQTLSKKQKYAQKQYKTYQQLYKSGTVAEVELEEKEQLLITANNELKITRNEYQKQLSNLYFNIKHSREQQRKLDKEGKKLGIDFENETVALNEQIRLAKAKLLQNYGDYEVADNSIILKATQEGKVNFLFAGDKEVLAGTTLLKLNNATGGFYALAMITPQHIGQIQTTNNTILKVATFPHFEWGVLKGSIAPLPLSPNEQGLFPIKININDFGKLEQLLQIGMKGEAAVLIEERSFFGYLTKNMKATYYEMLE